MATTWLITREADDARGEREAWSARGVPTVSVPCVETRALPWPWPAALPSRGSLTFFTSRRAVASWSAAGQPALAQVAALSPATSEALQREGVSPGITSASGVVSLAQAVLAWWTAQGRPSTTLRYPTSEAGTRSPEQAEAMAVLARVGEVDRRLAYGIAPPAGLKEALERAVTDEWAISFASPSAVQHFFAAGAALARPPVRVACKGASTQRAWNSARPEGWPEAVSSTEVSSHPKVAS